MSKKSFVFAAAVVLAGCAGQKEETKATGPTETKQVEQNVVPFDLYNCWPRKVDVPTPVNVAGLQAVWVAAAPLVNECLINPANRGQGLNTDVNVTLSDTAQGPNVEVTGNNLTPSGTDCVKKAVLASGNIPALAATDKPVSTGVMKTSLVGGRDPSLRPGLNEISDLAIPIRLAQQDMCSCFEPFKGKAPSSFIANIDVKKAQGAGEQTSGEQSSDQQGKTQAAAPKSTVTVTFSPFKPATAPAANTPATQPGAQTAQAAQPAAPTPAPTLSPVLQQITSCVQPKIQALNLKPTSDEVKFQLPFYLMNTAADVAVTDAPNPVRFYQLDGLRRQRSADASLAVDKRIASVRSYSDLVNEYNANKKKLRGKKLMETVQQLAAKCQDMVASDDGYKKALQSMLDVDQRTLQLAQELAAKDQRYNVAVKAAQKQVTADQDELGKVEKQRDAHEAGCPKVHY